jgi:integration host factor subunit beta
MVEADPDVRIELRDFGVFEVKRTKARTMARNPRTNEPVFVPSRRKTHFRASKRMREALQQPLDELGYASPDVTATARSSARPEA